MMYSTCIDHAATAYGITRPAIETVIKDPAGSNTVGPMHIPAAWLPILARVGFSEGKIKADPCENIAAGTWILAFAQIGNARLDAPEGQKGSNPKSMRDLPSGITATCINDAATSYSLPATLLLGILATEGGKVGTIHYNSNGSYDMGPAQINSSWLPKLEEAGYTKDEIINNGCLNIHIGAWILSQAMTGADKSDPANFWQHVGDYNSHTPAYNARYAAEVWHHINQGG